MASKKRAVRRKPRRKSTKRGAVAKFVRTIVVSAVISFVAVTWAINPQIFNSIDIDRVLARFDFSSARHTAPLAPAPVEGVIQTSFAQCQQFFPEGRPPIVPVSRTLRELCFTSFAILHSGQTKTPVFVAQRLNRQMLVRARGVSRSDRFYDEARLPKSERAALADYQGSGYDRGHLAPAGDMHNDDAMAQSFSLANMVPQNPQHNRGAWNKIEQDTRKYVMRAKGDVYIFTGPVYAGQPKRAGGRVAVPTYLYKVVYDATSGRSWVHWHENHPNTTVGAPISYGEFVRRTGLYLLISKH